MFDYETSIFFSNYILKLEEERVVVLLKISILIFNFIGLIVTI